MTSNLLLFLAFILFKNCYAFTEPLYEGSNCEVEGKPGICKALPDCPEEYHLVRINETQATKRCSFLGNHEIVCCEIKVTDPKETGEGFFDIRSTASEVNILCSFNGTLPVRCCPSDQVYAAPILEAGCPPPPAIEQTDNIIKKKCLEYSQYGFPCMRKRGVYGQFLRQGVCFQAQGVVSRIVGGWTAEMHEYPHMVMLGYKLKNEEIWSNGGTLISERAVLTAAHAVSTVEYGDVKQVCMGLHDRRRACRNELRYRVKDITAHKQYRPGVNYYDIAILLLDRTVTMNEYVRPACLPYSKPEGLMKRMEVTGWGLTTAAGEEANALRKTTIDEFENEECARKHTRWAALPQGWRPDTMMCAGTLDEENDSCQGDSGGPVQIVTDISVPCSYVVVGVVSSGIGCGVVGSPGVYTRVAGFTDWIVKEIWPQG